MTYDDSIDITIRSLRRQRTAGVRRQPLRLALNIIENTTAGSGHRPARLPQPTRTTPPPIPPRTLSPTPWTPGTVRPSRSIRQGKSRPRTPWTAKLKPAYTVTVSVSDGKDARAAAADSAVDDSHTVTITIDNEVEPPTFNEEPPQGQNSLARSVAENTPAGQRHRQACLRHVRGWRQSYLFSGWHGRIIL